MPEPTTFRRVPDQNDQSTCKSRCILSGKVVESPQNGRISFQAAWYMPPPAHDRGKHDLSNFRQRYQFKSRENVPLSRAGREKD